MRNHKRRWKNRRTVRNVQVYLGNTRTVQELRKEGMMEIAWYRNRPWARRMDTAEQKAFAELAAL